MSDEFTNNEYAHDVLIIHYKKLSKLASMYENYIIQFFQLLNDINNDFSYLYDNNSIVITAISNKGPLDEYKLDIKPLNIFINKQFYTLLKDEFLELFKNNKVEDLFEFTIYAESKLCIKYKKGVDLIMIEDYHVLINILSKLMKTPRYIQCVTEKIKE